MRKMVFLKKFLLITLFLFYKIGFSYASLELDVDKSLKNKVVFITGASGDIGRGIVQTLLENTEASLVLHYGKNIARLKEQTYSYQERIHFVMSDFSDPSNASTCFDAAQQWKGKIDILINSCGIEEASYHVDEKLKLAQHTFNINYFSPMMICEYALASFQEKKIPGIIINMGSRAAYRGLSPELFHYSDSKAALHRYTQQVAKSYAPHHILAYILAPGPIEGNMLDSNPPYLKQQALESMPTRKAVSIQEISDMLLFLAQRRMPSGTGGVLDFMGASYSH